MQGHQNQRRYGIRSTTSIDEMVTVSLEQVVHEICSKVVDFSHLLCTDQTGKFPVQSRSGNKYLLMTCDCDENFMLSEPIPNRKTETLKEATLKMIEQVNQKEHTHTKMQLDNESSEEYLNMLRDQGLAVQLALPCNHRKNISEHTIQTCKNHLIAGISGADPSFPMTLWDELIPQANITINLLRNSRINPKLSTCAQICGQLYCNKTLLAPPGCKCIIHETTAKRNTWEVH